MRSFQLPRTQHQQTESRHVARGKIHLVLIEIRVRGAVAFALARAIEVLHADRSREVGFERVIDVAPGQLLEGGAGGVEVPVLILEVGSRRYEPRRGDNTVSSSLPEGK